LKIVSRGESVALRISVNVSLPFMVMFFQFRSGGGNHHKLLDKISAAATMAAANNRATQTV
jgi:hypothetical protein